MPLCAAKRFIAPARISNSFENTHRSRTPLIFRRWCIPMWTICVISRSPAFSALPLFSSFVELRPGRERLLPRTNKSLRQAWLAGAIHDLRLELMEDTKYAELRDEVQRLRDE